jgi:hypothetical protein
MEDVAKSDRGHYLPYIYTPLPVIGMAPEVLDKYIAGNDPDTKKPVIKEIIDALTKPVSLRKPQAESAPPEIRKVVTPHVLLGPDTEDNLHRLFYDRGWTDGSPIILPTEERVQNMLAGTGASPDAVVGEEFLLDTREHVIYTVSNIAVIAVMAGARPEYFPVILAIASANRSALSPSTTAFASLLLVNGPIRNEIGMNSGINAFGPGNMANAVLGRAWTLMSFCHGHGKAKNTMWTSQGSNLTYNNMCIAENEEKSPWPPFHVDKGFKAEESVVSIFGGWGKINSPGAASNRSLVEELSIEYGVIPPLDSNATIAMDPLVARNIKENLGFANKLDYCRYLSKNIKIPAGQYWKTDYIDMLVASQAYQGVEPYASWKKLPDDALIAPFHTPENINLIVVGGGISPLWKATDYRYGISVSVDRWRSK